jgi:hypothetical protein
MATAPQGVLHEYKPTVLVWLIPLFFVIGCLIVATAVGLGVSLRSKLDASMYAVIIVSGLLGLGMPVLAIALWLLIPGITTTYDPGRRVLRLEYRRPLGRSVKEIPVDDIADIGLVAGTDNTSSLALFLKSGKTVRLDLSASSDRDPMRAAAARIKAAIGLGAGAQAMKI